MITLSVLVMLTKSLPIFALNNIFACVSSAPFGFPVVPEVYKMIAVSSEEHCTVLKSLSSELVNNEKSNMFLSREKLSKDLITHIF